MEERLDDAIHVLRNHAESSPHLPPGHPAMQGMMGPPPTHSNGLHMPPGPPGAPHHVGGHYPGMPPHHMPPHHPHMDSHMVCMGSSSFFPLFINTLFVAILVSNNKITLCYDNETSFDQKFYLTGILYPSMLTIKNLTLLNRIVLVI